MKSEIKFQVSKTYGAGGQRRGYRNRTTDGGRHDERTQCGAHLWAAKAKGGGHHPLGALMRGGVGWARPAARLCDYD